MGRVWCALVWLWMVAGCSAPADPVELGTLCYPATGDCAAQRVVTRGTVLGRNAIDLLLTNTSSAEQTIEVAAGPPLLFEQEDMGEELVVAPAPVDMGEVVEGDMGVDDPLNPALDDLRGLLARRRYVLAAGQQVRARIVPNELGRQANVLIRVSCAGEACAATLQYIVVVEPLACSEDGDCDGAQVCDVLRGQCVECLSNSQCLQGQRCELGRCTPPQVSSCQSAPGGGGLMGWWLFIAWGLWRGRRRLRGAACAAAVCAVMLGGGEASAQEVRAGFTVGTGAYVLTGELGEQAQTGLGLALGQEVRGRYVGVGVDLTAAYFVTDPAGVALSRELVLYSAQPGPRGFLPLGPVELVLGGGYERMGLAENSLVELTGVSSGYHGVSGWAGARLAQSLAVLEARVGYHHYFGLPGAMWTVTIAAGIAD